MTGKAAETRIFKEKEEKYWAITPKPEYGTLADILQRASASPAGSTLEEINLGNLQQVLQLCVLGLAHVPDLAERRLQHALEHPRTSHERLYDRSFVEAAYHAGPLAVMAYTGANDSQPNEWLVEGFRGNALEPEIHTLPMTYAPVFGADVGDVYNLEAHIEEWYP